MARSLLTAALIVKNEALLLPECLASLGALRPVLSEIVVYDTGSTDGTQDIARAHGARVRQGGWTGDFAAARNIAIGMARSRWVLIVDADERVYCDATALGAALRPRSDGIDAMTLCMQCLDAAGHTESSFPSARLLDPRLAHYQGAVHEQVVPRIGRRRLRGVELAPSVIRLEHVGYMQELLPAKRARNEELADTEVRTGLQQGRSIAQLIQPLVDRARSRVNTSRLAEAVEDFEMLLGEDLTGSAYAAWGLEFYADLLLRTGDFARAGEVVQVLAGLPLASQSAVSWLRVRILQGTEQHHQALTLLRDLNTVQSSTNLTTNNANLTFARLRAAMAVGEFEEALACCLSLVVDHGRTAGLAPELIALWHDRPVDALVEILSAAQQRTALELSTQLQQVREPGPTIADRLLAAQR